MKTLIKVLKFLLKNWIPVSFAVLIFVILTDKSCDESAFRKDIAVLDTEIVDLRTKNVKLEDEAFEYIEGAKFDKEIVEGLKAEISASKTRIKELEKEEAEVDIIVAELPVIRLVEDTRLVLDCAEVELTEDGILFSVECTRSNLAKLKKFSLVEGKYKDALLALSTAEEALHFSERRSLKLFGALWKYGSIVINYKRMDKIQDKKYERSEKQRKRSYFKGVVLGITIGAGITITIVLIIPLIRWIF